MDYNFDKELATSRTRSEIDKWAIEQLLPDCIDVRSGTTEDDRAGIDYFGLLKDGREVPIDAKSRRPGSSKYWKGEPELPMERWSVCPSERHGGTVGWTLDRNKATEYILFTFDPADSRLAYLVPFQLLRAAFLRWGKPWLELYGRDGDWFYESSNGGEWTSAALFVPASVVIEAVRDQMTIRTQTGPVCARCGVNEGILPIDDGRLVCPGCNMGNNP